MIIDLLEIVVIRLNGDINPGVTIIDCIYFGLKNTTVNGAQHTIVRIDAPLDNSGNKIGPNYYIQFDIVGWTFESIPESFR